MGVTLTTPSPIPAPLSRFIGRRRELEQLRLLVGPDRLVTIVGAGGCGKTRLAIELARGLAGSFPDGSWLVEFARIEDPDRVATAIAEAVHALKHPGTSRLEGSAQSLAPGRQLVVLDNCEHVLTAVTTAVRFLLASCQSLTILATSREPLDLEGERVWRLQPLSLPKPDGSGQSESVELFQDRARLVVQDAQLPAGQAADVAAICLRLDGLPLALELAAAWVPVISLKQVVARLDEGLSLLGHAQPGMPSRHRTMRAAVEWSYQLLDPSLQAAFERLSVCAGGFTLAGADAVLAGVPAGGFSALDVIAALVARSLVVADTAGDEARYRLLEPVRQFAIERLQLRAGGSNDPRERYLRYLVGIAEAAEESILGGPDMPSLRLLDAELANIRALLPWAFAHSRKHASRLTVALIWFLYIRSLYDEGIQWAETARRMTTGRIRARAAHMAGVLSSQRSDIDAAERYLAEARDLLTSEGWQSDLTMVMFDQFVVAYHRGDIDAMRARGQEAFDLARELHDEARIMQTLFVPATLALMDGDFRKAGEVWREAIAHAERRGASWSAWMFRVSLADVLVGSGDWPEADKVVAETLRSASEFRDAPITTAYLVESAAILAIERGERLEGLRLMAAARATFDRLRYRVTAAEADRRRHWIDTARRDVQPARADAAWKDGLSLSLAEATAEAHGVVGNDAHASIRSQSQTTRTFMFTDVVGSTALIGVIGDEAWQHLIDWHNRMLRQKFVSYEGDEVDSAGDGFFVAFSDAREAAACAIDIQRMLAEHRHVHGFSPSVRIGLHETTATRSGNAYRGRGVHLAARIAAHASGNEILVSSDTAARLGAGYALSPPRSIELKGFRDPTLVAALDWR
jgi:predicted ATPase/class 3 adenylate cyclase